MKRALAGVVSLLLVAAASAQQPAPESRVNPFAPVAWQPAAPVQPTTAPVAPPAPAPQPQIAAPAPPSPPPLPFRYLGRYTADAPLVVLTKGDAMFLAKAGDTLDGGWRVDSIGGPAIQLTYLPLQVKQSIPTGDSH